MKTAISIPDNTFELAEHFANSAGMTRSELYTTAVLEYLKNHKKKT
ncbi:MAG: metal-responsive CopG/Arc/MetJ family transcriptional regulator [Polaribacter sp.]|jgi:metal-responsive CopG/Arc/MetJ family transcriptional regulator